MMGTTWWPSLTASAPPIPLTAGQKSFCTSMTRRASVGWSVIAIGNRVHGQGNSGSRCCANAHLNDDETVAKMGHPVCGNGRFPKGMTEKNGKDKSTSTESGWDDSSVQRLRCYADESLCGWCDGR